jgi:hypothetical protein
MAEHASQHLVVRILEENRHGVIFGEASGGDIVQTEPLLDELLHVVRGVRLHHNAQRSHVVSSSKQAMMFYVRLG